MKMGHVNMEDEGAPTCLKSEERWSFQSKLAYQSFRVERQLFKIEMSSFCKFRDCSKLCAPLTISSI